MAHYAQLDSENVVVNVFVGRDDLVEGIDDWETYYAPEGSMVKQTSYNTRGGVHYDPETGLPSEDQTKALRSNYAGIGFTYDEERDAFIPPKPFESWVLDEATCLWVAPVPAPEETDADGNPVPYVWDEDAGDWVIVSE
jgi:hypothetical protein